MIDHDKFSFCESLRDNFIFNPFKARKSYIQLGTSLRKESEKVKTNSSNYYADGGEKNKVEGRCACREKN